MGVNIMRNLIICYTFCIASLGLLINHVESYLPAWISRTYRFGKSGSTRHSIIEKLEVPKKWFGHLYILAISISVVLFYLIVNIYLFNERVPEFLLSILDTLLGTPRKPLVSIESTILALVLMSIHIWKRAYESYYVSVFSGKKINLFHYLLGYIHYLTTLLSLVGESEGFVRGSHTDLARHKFTTTQLICGFIFLWATYMQLRSNLILARLRKNEHGNVVTKEYKIPHGELFTYISNPLQFTEILIYMTLSGILWQTSTYHYVTIFVIVNQVESAYLYDQWHRNTFKNYPKERKILIPYVW